ncbi:hypothetical protein K1719_034888 [Acacia pycnantha]|nr:hypothetical protein K1719_034888 [Acacia pycnantha]
MAVILTKLKLSLLLLLMSLFLASWASSSGKVPPICHRFECTPYDVIHVGDGYEIRHYNSNVWVSTPFIKDTSFVEATRTGFGWIFDYVQGKNDYKQKIEMTAPIVTEVAPCYGGLCVSTFEVNFYMPKKNHANPPPTSDLVVGRSKPVYAAARKVSGYVRDFNVGEEAAALKASIAGTEWLYAIEKSNRSGYGSVYCVAQYNNPFEYESKVNEVFYLFDDLENGSHSI